MPYAYTVRCTFTDRTVADRWMAWLRDEHLADVIAAGAESAAVVALEGEATVFEVRYRFASREAYDAYVRDDAPRLRAEGLRRFPLELGLTYERSAGEVVASARSQSG